MQLFQQLQTSVMPPCAYQPKQNQAVDDHSEQQKITQLSERISDIKQQLGDRVSILCHHYQKDEVVQFADEIGDSLFLAQRVAQNKLADYIVFCGVHFMAETADMLTESAQTVILPDLNAGCSMADMATRNQLQYAWQYLTHYFDDSIIPITYINSTAAVKAFVGQHGGVTVTSTNAPKLVEWALTQKKRLLFLPDQHLGRNTAYQLGIALDEMALWDPLQPALLNQGNKEKCKVILWNGYCSVHQQFSLENVEHIRKQHPNMKIIVHPECSFDIVQAADMYGSTDYIIRTIRGAKPGTEWAVGTDNNLVYRLMNTIKDKKIVPLNTHSCPCLTMNRIDLPHLAWVMDNLLDDKVVNPITVDQTTQSMALKALNKMLELS